VRAAKGLSGRGSFVMAKGAARSAWLFETSAGFLRLKPRWRRGKTHIEANDRRGVAEANGHYGALLSKNQGKPTLCAKKE